MDKKNKYDSNMQEKVFYHSKVCCLLCDNKDVNKINPKSYE